MLIRRALAVTLLCCANLAADEPAPRETNAPRYPDRAAGAAAPRQFLPSDHALPLDSTSTKQEDNRYRQESGAAHAATLEALHDPVTPFAEAAAPNTTSPSPPGPLPITRPTQRKASGDEASNRAGPAARTATGRFSLVPVFGSLGVVLGLFFLLMWILRRGTPKGSHSLPAEVVEVLGRTPLSSRQHAHLVRCGNKLLLVSLSAAGAETLTEVTDPIEVDRLAGLCRQSQPHSATATFRHIFQQFGRDRTARGFLNSAERGRVESLADADEESVNEPTEEFHA